MMQKASNLRETDRTNLNEVEVEGAGHERDLKLLIPSRRVAHVQIYTTISCTLARY